MQAQASFIRALALIAPLFIGACATVSEQPAPVETRQAPRSVPTHPVPQLKSRNAEPERKQARQAASKPVVRAVPRYQAPPARPVQDERVNTDSGAIPATGSTAVVSLMHSADVQADPARAAAVLERALRIEPDNPVIWHRLAQSRLLQGLYQQAEAVALKSNALAIGDARLSRANWSIVAQAREALGDHSGASEAMRRRDRGGR